MAVASWPETLPFRPESDGWSNSLGASPLRTDIEGPAPDQRSRPGDGIETITWSRAISRAEFATLRAFVMGTLRHGAARFWMPVTLDRSTYGIRTVQIVSGSFTAVGINNAQVRVSMSLRVMPAAWTPPVPVITSVGSAITGTAANGSPVDVSIGSTIFSTTATSGDVWYLTVPWLADGIYDVRARIVIGGSPGPWGIPWQLTMPTPRIAAMREMMRGGPGLVADFLAGDALVEGGPSFYGAINGLPGLAFSRASAATRINAAGDEESVGTNVLRYDHDPVTLAPRGVLLESARTKLLSNGLMTGVNPGAAGAPTVPGAPTGWVISVSGGCTGQIVGQGMDRGIRYFDLKLSGTNGASYGTCQIRPPNITTAAGVNRTLSLNLTRIAGTADAFNPVGCMAMLDAYVGGSFSGVRGQSPAGIPSGEFATSRVVTSVLTTPSGTDYISPLYQFLIYPSASVDITVRVGHWQVEDGKFASSFVGTTTSGAVTRAADALAVTLPQALDAAAGLTIAVRARAPDVNLLDPNNQGLFSLSSPDFADRLLVYRAGANNRPTYLAYDGGALVFAGSADPTPNSQPYRVGMRIGGNTLHVMRNGVVGAPIALSSAPSGLRTLHIGSSADQHIQSLVVIPSAVSDADFAGLLA